MNGEGELAGVSPDRQDGGDRRTTHAAFTRRTTKESAHGPVRERRLYSNCAARAPGIACSISRA